MLETGKKPGQDKFNKLKEVLGWLETFVAEDKFSAGTDWITLGDLALLATYSTIKVRQGAAISLAQITTVLSLVEYYYASAIPSYKGLCHNKTNFYLLFSCS